MAAPPLADRRGYRPSILRNLRALPPLFPIDSPGCDRVYPPVGPITSSEAQLWDLERQNLPVRAKGLLERWPRCLRSLVDDQVRARLEREDRPGRHEVRVLFVE